MTTIFTCNNFPTRDSWIVSMMPVARTIGILCFALAAGCAAVKAPPPGAIGQTGPLTVDPSLIGPGPDGAVAAERARPESKQEGTVTQKQKQ